MDWIEVSIYQARDHYSLKKPHTETIYATLDAHEFQDLLVSNRFLPLFSREIWHLIGPLSTSNQAAVRGS